MADRRERELESLARRAHEAFGDEDFRRARELYGALEERDPTNPDWPRRLAAVYGRSGDLDLELDALVRCGERHGEREEFLQALAKFKMVLSIDPAHVRAQERLSDLQPHAISVDYQDHDGVFASPEPPSGETAPLDELVLTDIVAGAHPSDLGDDDGSISEIPLESPPHGFGRDPELSLELLPEGAEHRLERCPLFSSLDRSSLAWLVEQVRLVELSAGEVLFRQGDPAGALYVVAHGAVVPVAETGARTKLAVLEDGEFFGEIGLFTNQPRNATVEALVDCQLLAIDRAVIWELIRETPEVLSVMLRFLRERLIDRLVRTSPLFQIFSRAKRSSIARRFRFLEVADGSHVVEQLRPTEALFILLSGSMDVVHVDEQGEKALASLAPGEIFGEMSLLWREPSLASVVARGKCWLLALPSRSFREMLDHHPELAELTARIADERKRKNQRTLRDALSHRDGKAGII